MVDRNGLIKQFSDVICLHRLSDLCYSGCSSKEILIDVRSRQKGACKQDVGKLRDYHDHSARCGRVWSEEGVGVRGVLEKLDEILSRSDIKQTVQEAREERGRSMRQRAG